MGVYGMSLNTNPIIKWEFPLGSRSASGISLLVLVGSQRYWCSLVRPCWQGSLGLLHRNILQTWRPVLAEVSVSRSYIQPKLHCGTSVACWTVSAWASRVNELGFLRLSAWRSDIINNRFIITYKITCLHKWMARISGKDVVSKCLT